MIDSYEDNDDLKW